MLAKEHLVVRQDIDVEDLCTIFSTASLERDTQIAKDIRPTLYKLAGAMLEYLHLPQTLLKEFPEIRVKEYETSAYGHSGNYIKIAYSHIGSGTVYGEELMHWIRANTEKKVTSPRTSVCLSQMERDAVTEFIGYLGKYVAREVNEKSSLGLNFRDEKVEGQYPLQKPLYSALQMVNFRRYHRAGWQEFEPLEPRLNESTIVESSIQYFEMIARHKLNLELLPQYVFAARMSLRGDLEKINSSIFKADGECENRYRLTETLLMHHKNDKGWWEQFEALRTDLILRGLELQTICSPLTNTQAGRHYMEARDAYENIIQSCYKGHVAGYNSAKVFLYSKRPLGLLRQIIHQPDLQIYDRYIRFDWIGNSFNSPLLFFAHTLRRIYRSRQTALTDKQTAK